MFLALSRSRALKRLASRYGMATPGGFARRFIAGESVEEAVAAARALEAQGRHITLDYLGESVATADQATGATREYTHLIDALVAAGVERNLSLKLTQLGLVVDRATCLDNMRRILEPAQRHEFFVRIDMEGSAYTEATLEIFETLWRLDYRNIGIVLQSCLYRTDGDVRRMNEIGARVRLVKGAYHEPAAVAHQKKADVDAAYLRQMRLLLDDGVYPAFATHDAAIHREVAHYADQRNIQTSLYEFQLLYGVRRDLQEALLADNRRVRVYVPFGHEWYPYFMRRLGERPANVLFVMTALLGEWRGPRHGHV
jgi:proline dehydrogenase